MICFKTCFHFIPFFFVSFYISLFIHQFERISFHRLSLSRFAGPFHLNITAGFLIMWFMAVVNGVFGKVLWPLSIRDGPTRKWNILLFLFLIFVMEMVISVKLTVKKVPFIAYEVKG